ncbi:efflux RND transporter periplasmic adaptor subunit [Chondrinema litorale]|uniref:efflux RND transporter periplasmic adaptor subunit n=1 Tax=Chondrinema litorale TaxID=2994555 RepID=UPI0025434FA0|nr:efflux RND transporter periplasmic adaptor subunit [Chondrinema litorale]UZR96852.1 efflux RND transporter periplasmic adaptor subunit [Chondrinema litorale]
MQNNVVLTRVSLLLICIIPIWSCQKESNAPVNQVPEYTVLKVNSQETVLTKTFPAIIEGQEDIDIRPKIEGYIEEIYIDEGAVVKKGDLLFKINAPQYAELLKAAEVDVKNAQIQVEKAKPLVVEGIINTYELEAAELALEAKKSALTRAKTDLGYTIIKSPVDGVVGTIAYRTGSLVNPQLQTPLTIISNIDKIHAYFSMDEREFLNFYASHEGNTIEEKLKNFPKVNLQLSNGNVLGEEGSITSVSGVLNQATGSARFRATFNNEDKKIRSGGSCNIIIPQKLASAILVPQKSTFEMQDKRMVLKVEDNKVYTTEIHTLNNSTENNFVVTNGLSSGDVIIYEGAGNLRDSMEIQPKIIRN